MIRDRMRLIYGGLLAIACGMLLAATTADTSAPATIIKSGVALHAKPEFSSQTLVQLDRNTAVNVIGQQGLWFQLSLQDGKTGYVRVNEVRVAYGKHDSGGIAQALFTGKAGKGRVTETASVRGLDESDLKAAAFDPQQLQRLESYRASDKQAKALAAQHSWKVTKVPYPEEFRPDAGSDKPQASQEQKRKGFGFARSLLGVVKPELSNAIKPGEKMIGKSDAEIRKQELALGPLIAGRVLGVAPLIDDPAAQQRVNRVGRWLALRTSRPELPWAFGVIEDDEINAFAAPGGYVLITRGLYQLLDSDAELAGVLAHEISHVVQRDHYEVIHKQEIQSAGKEILLNQVKTGGNVAETLARNYIEKNGAAIMLTQLDRNAEYRADRAAGIYLARAGANPLAYYAVLQKMAAFGSSSPRLASLYKTHPPLDKRLDKLDKQDNGTLAAYLGR